MILGAHESIAGGLHKAFDRAREHGAEAMQIFVKNARGWRARPLLPKEVEAFRAAARASGVRAMAHASYLINLAAPPGSDLREKSLAAFVEELERCEALGIEGLVVHPGSHPDSETGLSLVVEAIDEALDRVPGSVEIWLENTAGQGHALAWSFEQIGAILRGVRDGERLGLCIDTCHAWAAGYDSVDGWEATLSALEAAVGGLHRVRAFHLNDCKKELGCRVDRHEDIGDGSLGLAPFARLVRDERFADALGVLETPTPARYTEQLERLRSLA